MEYQKGNRPLLQKLLHRSKTQQQRSFNKAENIDIIDLLPHIPPNTDKTN
jgi:hypothetical protein